MWVVTNLWADDDGAGCDVKLFDNAPAAHAYADQIMLLRDEDEPLPWERARTYLAGMEFRCQVDGMYGMVRITEQFPVQALNTTLKAA